MTHSAPSPTQLADLLAEVERTRTLVSAALDHLKAAIEVVRIEADMADYQPVTLRKQ